MSGASPSRITSTALVDLKRDGEHLVRLPGFKLTGLCRSAFDFGEKLDITIDPLATLTTTDLGIAAALGLTSAVAAPRPMSAPPPAELPKILNRGTMRDPPLPLLLPPRMATADLALRTTRDVLVAFSGFGGGGSGLCKSNSGQG